MPSIPLKKYIELNAPFYPNFSKEDMHKYLHCFEMDMDVNLGALSMGQKKKVFMSFALATNTSLLLMDEPTSNLDSLNEGVILKAVKEECRDKTVLLVSHRASTMAVANTVYSVESGRVS